MKRILILSANPHNTDYLDLSKEVRDIDMQLKQARNRDQFELIHKGAVSIEDFYNHMLEVKPNILHFCGHGGGEYGLVLRDDAGKAQFLQTAQLAGLFKLFADQGLECVVLNACYSEVQAKAINQFIPYVIGMNQAIGDSAAIKFAKTFYAALGSGENIDFSFRLAKTRLMEFSSDQKVELLKNPDLVRESTPIKNSDPSKDVLDLLKSLLRSQFEEVVFTYPVPSSYLSKNVSQAQEAIEVIEYAKQKEGSELPHLLKVIHGIIY